MKLDYTIDRRIELERDDAREEGWEEGIRVDVIERAKEVMQVVGR